MGASGVISSMIQSYKMNRNLGRIRISKFSKNGQTIYSSPKKQRGFQFKEPNPEEVKALRERFRREDRQSRIINYFFVMSGLVLLIYLYMAVF